MQQQAYNVPGAAGILSAIVSVVPFAQERCQVNKEVSNCENRNLLFYTLYSKEPLESVYITVFSKMVNNVFLVLQYTVKWLPTREFGLSLTRIHSGHSAQI